MLGEVFLPEPEQVVTYYGNQADPELHLSFNFKPLFTPWDPIPWRDRIDEVEALFRPAGVWPTWVLSNHDQRRHRTRFGSEARARAATVLLVSLRGTPFLFAGEELGLEDAVVPPERRVDPGGRDGCRAPLPWDSTPSHGWAGGPDAWLPWPPGADSGRTVADQRQDPQSMLYLYRQALSIRRGSPALRTGSFSWLESPEEVLAYRRSGPATAAEPADERLVAVNFSDAGAEIDLPPGQWSLDITTEVGPTRRRGPVVGQVRLAPNEAVILRPA